MPHYSRLLAGFRYDTDFDQSLQVTSFRRSWSMDRKIHKTLADASNQYTVVGEDQHSSAPSVR